ncbi:hypothetical protein Bca4012_027064 [Brassica carinata]
MQTTNNGSRFVISRNNATVAAIHSATAAATPTTTTVATTATMDDGDAVPRGGYGDDADKIGDWKQLTEAELDKNLIQKVGFCLSYMFNERTKSSDFLQAMSSDFGLSCCEIQYGSCLDDKNKLVKIQSKKKVKKNTKRKAESCTLDPSCYVANVMPSSLRYDMLYIPKSFARANGLET